MSFAGGGAPPPPPPSRHPKYRWCRLTRVVLGAPSPNSRLCSVFRCPRGGGGRGGGEPPHQRMTCMAWSPGPCRMPCIHACGSHIPKQGVRSGGRGGAEPPHQRMSNACVEGSTSRHVSVEQGPFAHRPLFQGMIYILELLQFACIQAGVAGTFLVGNVKCQSPVMHGLEPWTVPYALYACV